MKNMIFRLATLVAALVLAHFPHAPAPVNSHPQTDSKQGTNLTEKPHTHVVSNAEKVSQRAAGVEQSPPVTNLRVDVGDDLNLWDDAVAVSM